MKRSLKKIFAISILTAYFLSGQVQGEKTDEACGLDELNHSILVGCNECSSSTPKDEAGEVGSFWPEHSDEVIHIQSTREGKRFSRTVLKALNQKVGELTRLFDINTTVSVKTEKSSKPEIIGIGCTLDAASLAQAIEQDSFEPLYGLIFDDLFGKSPSSASFALLRLQTDAEFIKEHNLTSLLLQLDNQISSLIKRNGGCEEKLKILVQPKGELGSLTKSAETLPMINNQLINVSFWGLALEQIQFDSIKKWRYFFPETCKLFAFVSMMEAPNFLKNNELAAALDGLLIKSEASVPYDLLDYLVANYKELNFITIGRARPQTRLHGDWSNAHEYAIEILNHLKHGANGFIEDLSVTDLRAISSTSPSSDCSIYSLPKSNPSHFRGPMFYAAGHFSRHLTRSRLLDYEVFTQPNMFSAHHSAFKTIDGKYIISIILNGNEHKQPFTWNIDQTIIANTLLEPKSFNTFVIKV